MWETLVEGSIAYELGPLGRDTSLIRFAILERAQNAAQGAHFQTVPARLGQHVAQGLCVAPALPGEEIVARHRADRTAGRSCRPALPAGQGESSSTFGGLFRLAML